MTKSEQRAKKKTMFTIKKWLIIQAVILCCIVIYGFYNAWTPQGNFALAIGVGMFISYMIMFILDIYESIKDWFGSKKHDQETD